MHRIVVLTEAGYEKGFGHFHRTSSVCERAQKKNIPVIMIVDGDESAKNSLQRSYTLFCDWQSQGYALKADIRADDIVVVDSYHVDIECLQSIQNLCYKLIIIDDNCRLDYRHMNILNPNYYAEYVDYPSDQGNTYFLGKEYTLLREAFHFSGSRRVSRDVKEVLITMGGTDPLNETVDCIHAIKGISEKINVHVVVTSAYQTLQEIETCLCHADTLYKDISAEEMSKLMGQVDFAVSAAGGTSNELIKMQCPSILKVVASNQLNNARIMSEMGCFLLMDESKEASIRQMMDYKTRCSLVRNMSKYAFDKNAVDFILNLAEG